MFIPELKPIISDWSKEHEFDNEDTNKILRIPFTDMKTSILDMAT